MVDDYDEEASLVKCPRCGQHTADEAAGRWACSSGCDLGGYQQCPQCGTLYHGTAPACSAACEAEQRARRKEAEQWARNHRFARQRLSGQDMLLAREPDEAGFYVSGPYDGEPFDESRFRVVEGGWDHEHCSACWAKVEPGDEWWAAEPPDEVGLCLDCHKRLFGR